MSVAWPWFGARQLAPTAAASTTSQSTHRGEDGKEYSFSHRAAEETGREINNGTRRRGSQLDEGRHELFEPSMFVGLNRSDGDTELLPTRPTNCCTVDEHGRMRPGKKDAESDHHTGFNRVRPIDTPSVEREVPSNPRSLKLIAGIIDRTLNGETTERPYVKGGTHRCARRKGSQRRNLIAATGHISFHQVGL